MPEVRQVGPDAWVESVAAVIAEGYDWFDSLHAVDEIGRPSDSPGADGVAVEEIRVIVRFVRVNPDELPPRDREPVELHTRVPRIDGTLPSLVDVAPGAVWHEREVHDFFGVCFIGGDDRPLLWHQPDGVEPRRPMLKDSVLVARAATAWPGAKDPEADGRAQASRRRTLPVGVPDPEVWGPQVRESGGEIDPAEVAASVSGGRVRRRRP